MEDKPFLAKKKGSSFFQEHLQKLKRAKKGGDHEEVAFRCGVLCRFCSFRWCRGRKRDPGLSDWGCSPGPGSNSGLDHSTASDSGSGLGGADAIAVGTNCQLQGRSWRRGYCGEGLALPSTVGLRVWEHLAQQANVVG